MFCKNCGAEVAKDARVCMNCGVKVGDGVTYCPGCGAKPDPLAVVCVKCGYELKKPNFVGQFIEDTKNGKLDTTTFIGAIKSGIRNYFNFKGRSGRAEFWWWTLFAAIVEALSTIPYLGWFVFLPIALLTIVPSISVTVRRLNDIGKPWPFIFLYLIPVAGIALWIVWGVQESMPDNTGKN